MGLQNPNLFEEEFPRLSETASPDRCRKCGSAIWKAYCRTGFRTFLDVAPVTPSQDLEFFISRRRTYRLWKTGAGFEIDARTPNLILGQDRSDVTLTEHRCDQYATVWPDYFAKPTPPSSPSTLENQEIPF